MTKEEQKNPYSDVYALTGIIGSGKSQAITILRELGVPTLSADDLARYVFSNNYYQYQKIILEIKNSFESICQKELNKPLFDENQHLIRSHLANIIFKDSKRVNKLNSIVHPHIKKSFIKKKEQITKRPLIYEIPLLFENNLQSLFKKTILVYTPEKEAILRASKRDKVIESKIRERLKHQISIEEKRSLVDYIIDNSQNISKLYAQVEKLFKKLT